MKISTSAAALALTVMMSCSVVTEVQAAQNTHVIVDGVCKAAGGGQQAWVQNYDMSRAYFTNVRIEANLAYLRTDVVYVQPGGRTATVCVYGIHNYRATFAGERAAS